MIGGGESVVFASLEKNQSPAGTLAPAISGTASCNRRAGGVEGGRRQAGAGMGDGGERAEGRMEGRAKNRNRGLVVAFLRSKAQKMHPPILPSVLCRSEAWRAVERLESSMFSMMLMVFFYGFFAFLVCSLQSF